ncbi:MAG: hypothetical protein PVI90_00390 [Desulfobacteraceae bacterium]|jgi:hypothetical protein
MIITTRYNKQLPAACYTLFIEWLDFSLWEKQAVLYMFMPYVEKIVRDKAHQTTQLAREYEPL